MSGYRLLLVVAAAGTWACGNSDDGGGGAGGSGSGLAGLLKGFGKAAEGSTGGGRPAHFRGAAQTIPTRVVSPKRVIGL